MTDAAAQLPAEFVERLGRIVPADRLDAVLASFAATKPTSFRVNTLANSPAALLEALAHLPLSAEPVPWCGHAFVVAPDQRDALTHSGPASDGRLYVQGLSSLLAALALAPQPGEQILDLAAAPGGKTLHLAQLMLGQGGIAAVEPVRNRFYKLAASIDKAGAGDMVRLFQTDGRTVGRKTPERFDRVLLDAPCSCEARFRAGAPSTFAKWSTKKVAECARKQKALLRSAVDACRVGGLVLYATCSMSPEENEAVVAHTLRRLGDAIAARGIDLPVSNVEQGLTRWNGRSWPQALALTRRVLPTDTMDAFYLALLEKRHPTT